MARGAVTEYANPLAQREARSRCDSPQQARRASQAFHFPEVITELPDLRQDAAIRAVEKHMPAGDACGQAFGPQLFPCERDNHFFERQRAPQRACPTRGSKAGKEDDRKAVRVSDLAGATGRSWTSGNHEHARSFRERTETGEFQQPGHSQADRTQLRPQMFEQQSLRPHRLREPSLPRRDINDGCHFHLYTDYIATLTAPLEERAFLRRVPLWLKLG